MMTVNGVSATGAGIVAGSSAMSQASDPVSKNLQRQINEAQKQLQELSANKDLSTEEKMKKRQELQKTISDLNVQLRQHQIEERRAKQQKQESFDDMLGGDQKTGKGNAEGQGTGMSQASMEAMISADVAMGNAKVQGSVATKMEGRAGVLKAEIALDAGRSGSSSIEAKQDELADIEKKAMNAVSSQMSSLAEAGKAMESAAETDESTEAKKSEEKKSEEEEKEAEDGTIESATAEENAAASDIAQSVRYVPVDVRV